MVGSWRWSTRYSVCVPEIKEIGADDTVRAIMEVGPALPDAADGGAALTIGANEGVSGDMFDEGTIATDWGDDVSVGVGIAAGSRELTVVAGVRSGSRVTARVSASGFGSSLICSFSVDRWAAFGVGR